MKVEVQTVAFKADQKLLDLVNKKVSKLGKYFDKVIDAEVYLKLDNKGAKVKDKVAEVKLNIPGNQLFAASQSKMFEEAIDDAVSSVKRQLVKYKDKIRS